MIEATYVSLLEQDTIRKRRVYKMYKNATQTVQERYANARTSVRSFNLEFSFSKKSRQLWPILHYDVVVWEKWRRPCRLSVSDLRPANEQKLEIC